MACVYIHIYLYLVSDFFGSFRNIYILFSKQYYYPIRLSFRVPESWRSYLVLFFYNLCRTYRKFMQKWNFTTSLTLPLLLLHPINSDDVRSNRNEHHHGVITIRIKGSRGGDVLKIFYRDSGGRGRKRYENVLLNEPWKLWPPHPLSNIYKNIKNKTIC